MMNIISKSTELQFIFEFKLMRFNGITQMIVRLSLVGTVIQSCQAAPIQALMCACEWHQVMVEANLSSLSHPGELVL